MNPRRPLVTLGFGTVLLALPVVAVVPAACGGYDSEAGTGGVGGSAQAGTGGTGGTAQAGIGGSAQGGTGGSAQAGTGGASGSAQAGTGAASGAGGSAQAGSGGTSGAGGSSGSGVSGGAGEGGQGASCDALAPCGGDLVGAWTVADCPQTAVGDVDLTSLGLGCTTVPGMGTLQVAGTITFNADGTYADNTTTAGESSLELPPSCLTVSGFTTTCDKVDNALGSIGFSSGGSVCVDNAATTGCSCTAPVAQTGGFGFVSVEADTAGTYTAASNKLTLTVFGTDTLYSYCVSGSTAVLTLDSKSKAGQATGPIVLQKQ